MPTPQGHDWDSVEQAEEYFTTWSRIRCDNAQCGAEYISFKSDVMTPCVHCSVPRRDGKGYMPNGMMVAVPLQESDPYLFEAGNVHTG